jgi:hypothetical protein
MYIDIYVYITYRYTEDLKRKKAVSLFVAAMEDCCLNTENFNF